MTSRGVAYVVCTIDEARTITNRHQRYWITNCGCREDSQGCDRSHLDLCLTFDPDKGGMGSNLMEVDREFVDKIFAEVSAKHLVPRFYRDKEKPGKILGICFCYDDCCTYFQRGGENCEKGDLMESSHLGGCICCGACIDVCSFGARRIVDIKLEVDRERCYGCGLCADVCPMHCIGMVPRKTQP